MNSIGNIIGEICKAVFPIPEESYMGNIQSSIAICTLSSINLLKNIANSDFLNNVSIVGRLLSENKGIDSIVRYTNQNKNLKTIIICGKEVWGHNAGHSLFQLHQNGIDSNGRIIGSSSPEPFLSVSQDEVIYFQQNIRLINMINETNLEKIKQKIF
ncbi:tetrahydromethanopterin S-methyltransferase subunit A [Nitrosopumilus sp. K4]|uniref:tetrahydromethanopterin S-methyltransferase subunit A n=1 Tax=Nitrosopumilus sp. K4 TaxID=2795383 RepID=UPI001BAB6F37|nr:tetrahydromethanopterin S-methyltransferase subunit A [Nitrosopumilus sp. K4]QUC64659.1 tetrahydromethanopterin S-methyltransferase subunit A [Nitrosopumilus sp. K4]